MANREHLKRIRQGASGWNDWQLTARVDPNLRDANLTGVNLTGANLTAADFKGANLSRANLTAANLAAAKLTRVNLRNANLREANLTGAILHEADLSGADLTGVNLTRALLVGTVLRGSLLTGTNLRSAVLSETIFADADLTQTLGLTSCQHVGPSVIDHRTLIRSGRLPLGFLRGCGLPETLITYLPSLLNQPIQFYLCFISYSTVDQLFADRLYADLQHNGVRCWFAPHHIQAGRKIHEQLDEAIRIYDRLLLILSEASMESAWVETEIAHARQKEINEHRRVLFPISLVTFSQIRQWKMRIPRRIRLEKSENITFPISATGEIMTCTGRLSTGFSAVSNTTT